jgi:hypothetical protein
MIRIYKNNDTKVVTKGAYEQFYKSLGYNIVLDTIDVVEETVETEVHDDVVEEVKETVSRPRRSSSNKRSKKVD